jgi:alpha-L-fucosidase 2
MKKPTGRPNGKWLVTNPSTSPKNFLDGGGNKTYFDEVTASFREGTTFVRGLCG